MKMHLHQFHRHVHFATNVPTGVLFRIHAGLVIVNGESQPVVNPAEPLGFNFSPIG